MASDRAWIRRDRDTGYLLEVTEAYVKERVKGSYYDLSLAFEHASKDNPLTTGFADYWPKIETTA